MLALECESIKKFTLSLLSFFFCILLKKLLEYAVVLVLGVQQNKSFI